MCACSAHAYMYKIMGASDFVNLFIACKYFILIYRLSYVSKIMYPALYIGGVYLSMLQRLLKESGNIFRELLSYGLRVMRRIQNQQWLNS